MAFKSSIDVSGLARIEGKTYVLAGGCKGTLSLIVACVDLRKFPEDRTWQLKIEGGWIGSPEALPTQLRTVGKDSILIGKCYPPESRTVGLIYTMARREPGWQTFLPEGLTFTQDSIRGKVMMSSGTDESLPINLELKVNDDKIDGQWTRKIEASKEVQKVEGKVTGGWDTKRVYFPTPWLKQQPRTYLGLVPEGGTCVVLSIDQIVPRQDENRGLTVVLVHDGNKVVSAAATALSFNQAWHEVDASKLTLKDGKVQGEIVVILHGDKWVPAHYPEEDRSPKAGRITIDVTLNSASDSLAGTAKAEWGVSYEAHGKITGEVTPTR